MRPIKLKSIISSRSKFSFVLLATVGLVTFFASCTAEDNEFEPQNDIQPQNEIIEQSFWQRGDTIMDPIPPANTGSTDNGGIIPPTQPPTPPILPPPPVKP